MAGKLVLEPDFDGDTPLFGRVERGTPITRIFDREQGGFRDMTVEEIRRFAGESELLKAVRRPAEATEQVEAEAPAEG